MHRRRNAGSHRCTAGRSGLYSIVPVALECAILNCPALPVYTVEMLDGRRCCSYAQRHCVPVYSHRGYNPLCGGFASRARGLSNVRLNQVLELAAVRTRKLKHHQFRHGLLEGRLYTEVRKGSLLHYAGSDSLVDLLGLSLEVSNRQPRCAVANCHPV